MSIGTKIGTGAGLCIVLALAVFGIAARPDYSSLRRVGFHDLHSQLIQGQTTIASANVRSVGDLRVLVRIDTAGKVIGARVGDNFQELDPGPALAAARSWRFRPQSFDGKPVIAEGFVRVDYGPSEQKPDFSVPFPSTSLVDTEITLERGACYGSCPDYKVTIRGDGAVRFSTEDNGFSGTATEVHRQYNGHNVLLPGVHLAHVDPAVVAALIRKFRAAGFFGMKPSYAARITDNPTQALTFRAGKISKRVVDYVGNAVGMPVTVSQLEVAVDEVAGTKRWVTGSAETVAFLEGEGFDFTSHSARDLVEAAEAGAALHSRRDNFRDLDAMILAMIDKGLKLDGPAGKASQISLGSELASAAAIAGDDTLFEPLAAKGYVARMGREALNAAFTTDMGCSPAIARALVKAGADPKAARQSGTALTAIRDGTACQGPGEERLIAMARVLIDLGLPLEARDELGWTALMGCDSPALARLLLAHGANPNARDKDGTTPVLATDDDRVALILLRAGANPKARNHDGTLREQAVKQGMPATLAWLDEHAIP